MVQEGYCAKTFVCLFVIHLEQAEIGHGQAENDNGQIRGGGDHDGEDRSSPQDHVAHRAHREGQDEVQFRHVLAVPICHHTQRRGLVKRHRGPKQSDQQRAEQLPGCSDSSGGHYKSRSHSEKT